MSTTWLRALAPNSTPPIHSVFLTFDPEDVEQGVTRYLVTEFGGQLLPFGVDRFDSEAEAKDRCKQDLGIAPEAWQEVAEEPSFHSILSDAREEAIESYSSDTEQGASENDADSMDLQ